MDSLLSQLYYCSFRILHIVDQQHSPLAECLLLCVELDVKAYKPRPISRKCAGVTSTSNESYKQSV